MTSVDYIFENSGDKENNDIYYPDFFELGNNAYRFALNPKTSFWRFGIRLFKSQEANLDYSEPRHINPEFPVIHIGVGNPANNWVWENPKNFHLVQYHLIGYEHDLLHQRTYLEQGVVEWKINFDKNKNVIKIFVRAAGSDPFSINLQLQQEYKYFKVFAWADRIPFRIECDIKTREAGLSRKSTNQSNIKSFIETDPKICITDDLKPVIEADELAKEVANLLELLRDPTGNMFGIFGKWGRGKTFLWKRIWKFFEQKTQVDTVQFEKVEFHAWKYQDTPASWAYLYETISDAYFKKKRLLKYREDKENIQSDLLAPFGLFRVKFIELTKIITDSLHSLFKRVKLNFIRKGILPIILFLALIGFYISWFFLIPKIEWLIRLIQLFGLIVFIKLLYLFFLIKPKAINLLSKYSQKVSFQKYLGLQAEIQKEIIFLMKTWISNRKVTKKKILLFVDDIDRCNEYKIIQVVDSLKVMLEDEDIAQRTTILVAIDERVLKMAINVKYHDLILKSSGYQMKDDALEERSRNYLDQLTKEYIDKLFISGVKLGGLTDVERYKIFETITKDKILENEADVPDQQTTITSSSTSTITATTESPDNQFSNQDDFFNDSESKDISREEFNLLKETLTSFTDATPRGIRIFYYRYLLAKKIIRYKFKSRSDLYSKWKKKNEKQRSILPFLIIHYSITLNPNEIEMEFKSLKELKEKKIKKKLFNKSFDIETDLFVELMKVVEMVVPY